MRRAREKAKKCLQCRRYSEQLLALACENEILEEELKQARIKVQNYQNIAHNRWVRLCVEERGAIQSWAMLDVMAKALESANRYYWIFQHEALEDIARKASVIKAYERAWVKGQGDPYTNAMS